MNITTFKKLIFEFIESHEKGSVYERSCADKESIFSVYIDGSCFLVKCTETDSSKNQVLR